MHGTSIHQEQKDETEVQFASIPVSTLGDGNCAFNAFALGLADGVLSDQISCPKSFFEKIRDLLQPNESTLENFKAWLRTQNFVERQQKLQGILRNIAVEQLEQNYQEIYRETYLNQLCNAYDNPDLDDTYKHHDHITIKMGELRADHDKERTEIENNCNEELSLKEESIDEPIRKIKQDILKTETIKLKLNSELNRLQKKYHEELRNWFESSGKKEFFENIKKSAEGPIDQKRWGGEPELTVLARYFNINISWVKATGKMILESEVA